MKIYFFIAIALLLERNRINGAPKPISTTDLLKFKQYLDLLNTFDHKFENNKQLLLITDKCYELASIDDNLDTFALAITNLEYAIKKQELFAKVKIPREVLEKKSEKEVERILAAKMTPEMEELILKFLASVSRLENVDNIVPSIWQKTINYLSNINVKKLTEEKKSSRKSCLIILDFMKSNPNLFQLYFDGLMAMKNKLKTTKDTSLFVKELSSYASLKKRKPAKEINGIIEQIEEFEVKEPKYSDKSDSSDEEHKSNVKKSEFIPTIIPIPIPTDGGSTSFTHGHNKSESSSEEERKSTVLKSSDEAQSAIDEPESDKFSDVELISAVENAFFGDETEDVESPPKTNDSVANAPQ